VRFGLSTIGDERWVISPPTIQGSQFGVPNLGFCFRFCYEGTFLLVHHTTLPPNLGTEVMYLILGV